MTPPVRLLSQTKATRSSTTTPRNLSMTEPTSADGMDIWQIDECRVPFHMNSLLWHKEIILWFLQMFCYTTTLSFLSMSVYVCSLSMSISIIHFHFHTSSSYSYLTQTHSPTWPHQALFYFHIHFNSYIYISISISFTISSRLVHAMYTTALHQRLVTFPIALTLSIDFVM
jgi:hypothetical protein